VSKPNFEILDSLPTYGPMYISVTENNESYFQEGFVVKFFQNDGNFWVGNFKTGWSNLNKVFDITAQNKILVIAGGLAYLMTPENQKPLKIFGLDFKYYFEYKNLIILSTNTEITIVNIDNGNIWTSKRISWDGIENLRIENNILIGECYDPTNSTEEWSEFSLNIDMKEINGGSW
jgi:hypothetical protein